MSYQLMLERLGYMVLAAGTPHEALRLAESCQGNIDVLLTDVIMPEMNGRVLSQKLLELQRNIRPLFMSGYTSEIIAPHGVLDKGVQFIEKPISKKDLSAKIQEVLENPGSAGKSLWNLNRSQELKAADQEM